MSHFESNGSLFGRERAIRNKAAELERKFKGPGKAEGIDDFVDVNISPSLRRTSGNNASVIEARSYQLERQRRTS